MLILIPICWYLIVSVYYHHHHNSALAACSAAAALPAATPPGGGGNSKLYAAYHSQSSPPKLLLLLPVLSQPRMGGDASACRAKTRSTAAAETLQAASALICSILQHAVLVAGIVKLSESHITSWGPMCGIPILIIMIMRMDDDHGDDDDADAAGAGNEDGEGDGHDESSTNHYMHRFQQRSNEAAWEKNIAAIVPVTAAIILLVCTSYYGGTGAQQQTNNGYTTTNNIMPTATPSSYELHKFQDSTINLIVYCILVPLSVLSSTPVLFLSCTTATTAATTTAAVNPPCCAGTSVCRAVSSFYCCYAQDCFYWCYTHAIAAAVFYTWLFVTVTGVALVTQAAWWIPLMLVACCTLFVHSFNTWSTTLRIAWGMASIFIGIGISGGTAFGWWARYAAIVLLGLVRQRAAAAGAQSTDPMNE